MLQRAQEQNRLQLGVVRGFYWLFHVVLLEPSMA